MEPVSAERTRRSSSRHINRGAFTVSPLRSRASTKRKRKVKASREVYSVRDILEEKIENDEVHYLIDWADNSDTGESYTPTWEPRNNVGWQAIADWNQKKLEIQNGGAFNGRDRSSTFDSDSEPLRISKRQKIAGGPVRSKLPQELTENPIGVHPAPQDKAAEIKDSYEDEQNLSNGTENVYVLVPKVDAAFDRGAYAIIPTSSDPSQASKPSLDSIYTLPSPEFKNPTPPHKPFLWDEPAPVIPDSQELPGSSSYILPEQETPQSLDTQLKSSYIPSGSVDQELEQSETSRYHPGRHLLPDTPVAISSVAPPSIELSSLSQPTRERNWRPSQLSVAFLTQNSESNEESWQAAQVRSPPPPPSTVLSTQAASIPQDISISQTQTSTRQFSRNVVESIEKVEGAAWSRRSEVQYPSSGSLPPRPTPPSNPNMADPPKNNSMSIADMLKDARARAATYRMARQAEARAASVTPSVTPSATPSATPSVQPPAVNRMLPLRSSSELQPPPSPSPRNSSEEESTSKALRILPLGLEEYVVPLPLNGITRDIYDGELTNFRRQQKASLENEELDNDLINEIDSLLSRLKELCDHQDLILSDQSTQAMDTVEVQGAWAENISTKCVFLSSFLTLLRPFNIHVTIVARPGRMSDILEAVLRKEHCVYNRPNRPDKHHNTAALGPMRISLLSSDFYKYGVQAEPTSMVIAFDSTFEAGRYPRQLRDDPLQPGGLAPLVHLTVVRSIEHFELCFDKRMDPVDRRAALLSCVMQSRHGIGVLPAGFYSPPAAAAEVGRFASAVPTDRSWPIRSMPDLDDLEFELDTAEEVQPSVVQPNQAQSSGLIPESYSMPSAQLLQPTTKRSLGAEDDDASSKRLRLTPGISDEAPRTMNPSRISNILNPMEVEPSPGIPLAENPDTNEVNLTPSLVKKVKDLEVELQRRDSSHASLRSLNQQLESRCKDLKESIRDMQPKYQEALNDRARFEHEMKESTSRANTMQQRLDLRVAELTKLQETKATSDSALAAARAELAGSAIPEIAELNKMRDEVVAVRSENERLQKRLSNMQNELEYMRTNYQHASSAAGEAVSDLNDVKAELATAQQKASENARRIHEYHASSEIKQHLSRIRELETEKSELEWELEKKSEELKAMLNGRRATRGTSVPRSPRMGTMSPGSRPMARVLSVGSRGNSPAPGDGPPYRGTFAGEALFTTAPASTRFGNHLM